MALNLDINKLFDSVIAAVASGHVSKSFIVLVLVIIMSPLIIGPLGKALNTRRQIDTKHAENMSKIRNSRADRGARLAAKRGEKR